MVFADRSAPRAAPVLGGRIPVAVTAMNNPQSPAHLGAQFAALDEEIAGVQRHLVELEQQHGEECHTALTACRTRLDQLRAKRELLGKMKG